MIQSDCDHHLALPERNRIHKRRLENAKIFLDELEEVEMLLISGVPMKMVPRPTFEKQIKKAELKEDYYM